VIWALSPDGARRLLPPILLTQLVQPRLVP
jgi:hypothetical protein